MKTLLVAFAIGLTELAAFGQGQVVFANKVGTDVDAPVLGSSLQGLGPNYSVQLVLMGSDGALTPLIPISTFRPPGLGAAAIADRYWYPQTVDVPVQPGSLATFVVRAWQTAAGSYEAAQATGSAGQSAPFVVAVGGGVLPPSNLTTLQSFTLVLPEPSVLALGILGAALGFLVFRRKPFR